jgi:hypothetical protein
VIALLALEVGDAVTGLTKTAPAENEQVVAAAAETEQPPPDLAQELLTLSKRLHSRIVTSPRP